MSAPTSGYAPANELGKLGSECLRSSGLPPDLAARLRQNTVDIGNLRVQKGGLDCPAAVQVEDSLEVDEHLDQEHRYSNCVGILRVPAFGREQFSEEFYKLAISDQVFVYVGGEHCPLRQGLCLV